MRQIITRRFKLKAGYANVAVLSESQEPEDEKLVIVLARRDLVFLQALFAALDRGRRPPNYDRLRKMVTQHLDTLSASRKPCKSQNRTSSTTSATNGRKHKPSSSSGA